MNKGNSADDCLPKFFKVYLPDDSGDDLDIPISFNRCLPKIMPKDVIVRSIYGNIWKMALKKRSGDSEQFVMVNGWKRILKNEDLKGGEFLAFEFDGSGVFNFCIYGRTTCKRLRSSLQIEDIEEESDGDDDDDIIAFDDDDDEDVNDDDEDVNDDDDGDYGDGDDEDSGDKDKSTEGVIVLDDDDGDFNDIENCGEEDKFKEEIIVLDDDDDDDNNERRGTEIERKQKGSSRVSKKSDHNENERRYLCNDMNPFFTVNHNLPQKEKRDSQVA